MSERLCFGVWTPEDWPLAWTLWGDPLVSARIGGPFSELQVRDRMQQEIATQELYGVQYWPIFSLADGEHVGCAGLRPYRMDDRIFELGFHLRPAFWGQGLAFEAGRAAVRYGFEAMGAAALFAGHHPSNEASRRVIEKLGFRYTHDEPWGPAMELHPSYLLRP